MNNHYNVSKRLTIIYITALSVIALVTILSYVFVNQNLVSDPNDPSDKRSHIGRMINFNGACATYAQEIALQTLLISKVPTTDSARTILEQIEFDFELLQKAYKGLKEGDEDYGLNKDFNTEEIKADFQNTDLYYEPFSKHIKEILQMGKEILPKDSLLFFAKVKNMQPQITETARDFSNRMLDLSFAYDQKAADEIAYWGKVELWLTIFALLVLFIEALFVFRPAVSTLNTYVKEIEAKNKSLQEAYDRIKANENQLRLNAENLAKTNADLLKSQQELREANLMKDKFFSIIVHDLKSPLNSLKAMVGLLTKFSDKLTTEEIQKTAQDLDKSIDGLFDFINNLLTWAKVQMQEMSFESKAFDLRDLIDKQLKLFKVYAQSKNITLKYAIPKNSVVVADPNYTDLVIRNLVSNAMKFTPSGGEIKVSAKNKGNFIEISVSDTGIGIESSILKNLFNWNNKHITSGTLGEKGTGLGLVLSREFVEKSGGTIYAVSEVGKGSTFTFTLPAYQEK
ncbi:sensor histidine kinase [Raineya orbicola]|jgi:signal transduction histidine kinase|uniref:histidine kinase n=1 Tax=Raineya orbicola TaxID=2016530 RepID=A0A2N3IE08_9BACT|nr:ATP-binding protein [Raineya orbicola]PKQ68562.1 Histidine kinase-, DNA gyrase B-, and HSP90-like ATPase [Raineya orbicola]